jgi:glycine cleavage system T protein (aminomethyltransferase)
MSDAPASDQPLKRTPLYAQHVALGAKMVPFAGYEMPVQYPMGILKEHLHTRAQAGLFDVSHMGQAFLIGPGHATTAAALETLVPADILNLKPGQQRYTQLLNDDGGIIDDLMVTRPLPPDEDGRIYLVVNASRREVDYAHLASRLPTSVKLVPAPELALIALQGPAASRIMAGLSPNAAAFRFMTGAPARVGGFGCHVSRSGYTGEDGFEISIAVDKVADLARLLLAQEGVLPIGLGARDSLRLEAGLCLYGHDIDETTSPVEADLVWSMQKRRRSEGGFPGAKRIQDELAHGPKRRRVGIRPDGRAPAREGTEILALLGDRLGVVTSGGFGPSVNGPVAMGYVAADRAAAGTSVNLMVRGKALSAAVAPLPFVPHRYAHKQVSDPPGRTP